MPDERTSQENTAKDEQINDLKLKLAVTQSAKSERGISDDRYARKIVETVVFGAIILFALAALFFIFTKVGLPVPSLP
jgi:hypothetical protein